MALKDTYKRVEILSYPWSKDISIAVNDGFGGHAEQFLTIEDAEKVVKKMNKAIAKAKENQ